MPNNLTIQIVVQGGAEARQAIADIGRAVRQTAADTQAANTASGGAWGGLVAAFRSTSEAVAPITQRFGELGRSVGELGQSVTNLADNVFPHFREVMALTTAAAAVAIAELVKSAAEGVRETENMAATLGYSAEQFEAMRLTAASAGVEQQAFNTSLAMFSRRLGQAREEQLKLIGAVAGGVTVLQGGARSLQEAGVVLRGGVREIANNVGALTTVLRGGVRAVYDFSNPFKALGLDINTFADNARGNQALLAEFARRLSLLGDSAVKATIAQQAFGRGWRESFPAFLAISRGLGDAEETIKRYSIGIGDAEREQANAFLSAYATMTTVLTRVKEMVGNALGSAVVPLIQAFTEAIGENAVRLQQWALGIAASVKPAIEDLIALMRGADAASLQTDFGRSMLEWGRAMPGILSAISGAVSGLIAAFNGLAAVINIVFGTALTGRALLVITVIGSLTGVFGTLAAAINVVISIGTLFATILTTIAGLIGWPALLLAGLVALAAGLLATTDAWSNFTGTMSAAWELIEAFAGWLERGFMAALDLMKAKIAEWAAYFADRIGQALAWLDRLEQKILYVASLGMAGQWSTQPEAAAGFAGGGQVHGPGGIDRVPAWLTAGEFVMNTRAVARYGLGLMRAINSLRFDRGFALGGLVEGIGAAMLPAGIPAMAFAEGGAVPSGGAGRTPVHLHIGGEEFALEGDSYTANRLVRFSRGQQMRAAGTKPSWYTKS